MTNDLLQSYGFCPDVARAFDALSHPRATLRPARITAELRASWHFVDPQGAGLASLSGQLRHRTSSREELPAVGDWVALTGSQEQASIQAVLPRRSALRRKAAGRAAEVQVLAANLDAVLLLSALDHDFNPRRLERSLALIWNSGAQPVLILNKADLCPDGERFAQEAAAVAPGVPIHVLSALHGGGVDALRPYLQAGRSLALLGSSGVGKSTLLNHLLGAEIQRVEHIRARDGRGQHTTTSARMLRLPGGALLIDLPGVREVGLLENGGGVEAAFGELDELAARCRFGDCSHGSEPGCAVQTAIEAGELQADRLASYQKLLREQAFIERKLDARAALNAKHRWKKINKQYRARTQFLRRQGGLRG